MPGASSSSLYDTDTDRPPSAEQIDRENDTSKTKKMEARDKEERAAGAGGAGAAGGGWLGGFLNKLSLRAPNQMILPDDKNPTIVWDAENKRWRNLDGDEDEPRAAPPPPRGHALAAHPAPAPSGSPPLQASGPPPATGANMFKMQKGRHIKKSYVDVFNPGGPAPAPLAPPPAPLGPPPAPLHTLNYFVPAPAPLTGMYEPAQAQAAAEEEPFRSGI